ncbi:MAG: glycosyltransferase 87 family protein [Bdellovibrionota bacterium]
MTVKSKKCWVAVFYAAVTLWLFAYLTLAHRYNGKDYEVYLDAIAALGEGASPYSYENATSFHYSPVGLLPFVALQSLPVKLQHLCIFVLSLFALFRMTYLSLKLLTPTRPLEALPLLVLIAPWLLVNQGIGFQFESGNINLLRLYLLMEGFNVLFRGKATWGFFLLSLPALFKPAFGIVPYFLFALKPKQYVVPCLRAGALLLAVLALPFVFWQAGPLYKDWWLSNSAHTHAILSGEIVGANLSLLSFAYDKLGLSVGRSLLLVFFPALVAFHWLAHKQPPTVAFALALLFLYLFSPATFPYSILGLMLPAMLGLWVCLRDRRQWVPFAIFVIGMLFVNVNFMGRGLYNGTAVPWRLQGFLTLPLVWVVSRRSSTN